MRTSISKYELLSRLIERGHKSPTDLFLHETESILFEEFQVDLNTACTEVLASVKESARNFRISVKIHYDKYQKLDPILTKNTVSSVTLQIYLFFQHVFQKFLKKF